MEFGGAETIIAQLCRIQRIQGHRPCVYCMYEMGTLGQRLRNENIEITLHISKTTRGLMRSLYRGLRELKPDVVHFHNATAAIVGAFPARLVGAKCLVVTRHGLVAPPQSLGREIKFALASRLCDWVVAVCDAARDNLRAAPFAARERIVRVHNGSEGVKLDRTARPTRLGFTLLHVGRLSRAKDQESLIKAFALARSQIGHLELWVVGEGPLRLELEQLTRDLDVEDAVTFFGEQVDVSAFYLNADLYVMSSITEGLPMSLLEAMSAGLPSVVTSVGGMAEVARMCESVVTVPPSDYRALAQSICEAAKNRCALDRLRQAARQCYETRFTLEMMARGYAQLYDCARDRRSPSPSWLSTNGVNA
jgi:glycosyltransferase involved in cell wall biosynthesis